MSKPSERIALVGSPNSGKSSLFNRLTGLRQKVANYPGVTVEKRAGTCHLPSGRQVEILDLPGTYSLTPRSPDEALVRDVLEGRQGAAAHADRVVAVVDATRLDRQLYLALQILRTRRPAMLVLNLMDEAEAQGIEIDVPALERLLGIPVLAVSAKTGMGVDRLRQTIDRANGNGNGHAASANGNGAGADGNGHAVEAGNGHAAAADAPWTELDPAHGFREVESIVRQVVRRRPTEKAVRGRLDAVLTHRIFGPLIFVILMATVFQSIYAWATPAMDLLDAGVRALAGLGRATIPAGPIQSLLVNGILAGVGTVASFIPQLAILFFFIAVMEDTGYMARAAFLMDRVMGSVGLPGRAFLPLLSSFACAIPGIMATRTLPSRNDRLATILIAPLMSCSARLPVYALLIGAFIPNRHFGILSLRGLTLLSMYFLGILAALGVAWVARRTVLRGPRTAHVLEMPPYRVPSVRSVFLAIRERCLLFLGQAGSVILAVSIVLWFLASYPGGHPETKALESRAAAAASAGHAGDAAKLRMEASGSALRHSFAGQLGHLIEPAIAPLGFDWKLGVGLLSSIAAREVMVSTMATMNNLDGSADPSESLRQALPRAVNPKTGLPLYTPLIAISLMVFFALALQCMSTVAVAKRETNSWRWPIGMLVMMNVMAWVASLAVYQGGRMLGWG
ncbi:MAG TPA: ferrous iron transport protein B [Candidatus Eisenbacteria bacterium]|nr:ferrous iron transport protein B [Candidatus Eisenbacteria bacterium]